jgi:hypothetical protein
MVPLLLRISTPSKRVWDFQRGGPRADATQALSPVSALPPGPHSGSRPMPFPTPSTNTPVQVGTMLRLAQCRRSASRCCRISLPAPGRVLGLRSERPSVRGRMSNLVRLGVREANDTQTHIPRRRGTPSPVADSQCHTPQLPPPPNISKSTTAGTSTVGRMPQGATLA